MVAMALYITKIHSHVALNAYRLDFEEEDGDLEAAEDFFEGDVFADLGVLVPGVGCSDAGDLEEEGVCADEAAEVSLVGVEEALPARDEFDALFEALLPVLLAETSSNSAFAMSVMEETRRGSTRGLASQALR